MCESRRIISVSLVFGDSSFKFGDFSVILKSKSKTNSSKLDNSRKESQLGLFACLLAYEKYFNHKIAEYN